MATPNEQTRRPARPNVLTPSRAAESPFLSELAMMASLGRPETFDNDTARHPSHQTFSFPKVGLRGRYDTATNRIVGAEVQVLPKLARAAWGEDAWFEETFLDMVPPPDVRDLRAGDGQVDAVLSLQVDEFGVGDAEVVFRVSYRPLLQVAGILRNSGRE